MGSVFLFCGFIVKATGMCFANKLWALILGCLRPAMVIIGYDLDRGGPKDSENAPNSFLTKSTEKGF